MKKINHRRFQSDCYAFFFFKSCPPENLKMEVHMYNVRHAQ